MTRRRKRKPRVSLFARVPHAGEGCRCEGCETVRHENVLTRESIWRESRGRPLAAMW